MKKVIVRVMGMAGLAVSVAFSCMGLGCDGNGRNVDWDGQVDWFLGRINETPGSGTKPDSGAYAYKLTVESIGDGATGSGIFGVGQTVFISAGKSPMPYRRPFGKWMASINSVTFEDATNVSTSFTMPAHDVTVKANFLDLLELGTFTDKRNNKTYKTTTVGGKTWMAENLNYQTSSGSWCYGEDGIVDSDGDPFNGQTEFITMSSSEIQANCAKYGRLYTWDAAKTACPAGWHLSTSDEWYALLNESAGYYDVHTGSYHYDAATLKSTSGWVWDVTNGRDEWGFSALPGGYRLTRNGDVRFVYAGYSGLWWMYTTSSHLISIIEYVDFNSWSYEFHKYLAGSVRCVVD
jgi:uncharacterized protein (TIGR02145 family)